MEKKDLIKEILTLGNKLESKSGFDAAMIVNKMEDLVDSYVNSLNEKPTICNHNWKMIGHIMNGHEQCTKCNAIGNLYG